MQLRRIIDRLLGRTPPKPFGRFVTRTMFVDEVDVYRPGEFPSVWPQAKREVTDVDILARTHVERSEHFVVPRFGA